MKISPFSAVSTFFLILLTHPLCSAQSIDPYAEARDKDSTLQNYRSIQQGGSATPDADAALSADVIVELLRREPALKLQVKRVLIQKALDQGRLLAEEDLGDTELFGLIRDEFTIRKIASDEIEKRHYLRLRPTDEEAFEARLTQRRVEQLEASEGNRQDRKQREGEGEEAKQGPAVRAGAPSGNGPSPQQPSFKDGGPGSLSPDDRTLPRVSPSELPQLLTASAEMGGASGTAGLSSRSSTTQSSLLVPSITPEPAFPSEREVIAGVNQPRPSTPRVVQGSAAEDSDRTFRKKPNPYAMVPSLYDLYEQSPAQGRSLERFGASIFENGTGNLDQLPMDVPVGPDYVIGPGDGLNVDLWGSVSQRLQRVVDREGRLSLPEVGTVLVAGKTLGELQQTVQKQLRNQFRDVQTDISLARLRTVRVYVVGDVTKPGPYDVSSLSTALNAVYLAGGPTSKGSLRVVRHYRGKELLEEVDLYDLLLHGVNSDVKRLEAGDSIQVPPVRPEVAIDGMVRRPARYELVRESSLGEVLELAGGVLPSAALRHIEIERVQAHQSRTMLSVDLPEGADTLDQVTKALASFKVQDGDRIRIFPILPYAQQAIYLDGHVFRPGKYGYREGIKISNLLHSYSDMLPEPSRRHAEIIRLSAPDFRPTVIAFNLDEALKGDPKSDLLLQPLDTIRVFSRYDFEDPPEVTVSGEVRKPGIHRTSGDLHIRDAVYLAGGLTADALLSDAQVFRRQNGKTEVASINLEAALRGDPANNLLLLPKDRLIIHRDLTKADPASVMVEGEVERPGKYPLGSGMTASELVRLAGGFKRSAYTDLADLSRYVIQDGAKVEGKHEQVEIAKAFASRDADVPLRDGDTLTIRPIAGFNNIGATVNIKGEVMHPSVYGIKEGERLSSVLKRAGGFAPDGYAEGIFLSRDSLRVMEEQNRLDLISRLQSESANQPKYKPGTSPAEAALVAQSASLQQQQLIDRLKNEPPVGRLVVHITSDIAKWQNGPQDVELRKGDVIVIPKRPTQVMVTGQVYNPTAVTYQPGKNADWYLKQSGGVSELANKKSIFVVRAGGSIIGREGGTSGFWHQSVLSTVLRPGDTVVVPEKLLGGTPVFKTMLESAQIISSIAVTAKAVGVF
ncbi:MAG TPA: SLBB domain-containing protein [Terriglobales bacterium]|jgi:polysaccharide export outer membrane protein|nr:SLBB domain-containing protein [Terriglobales bacterium]